MKQQKLILGIAVFLCGAIVMIYELVGSRILGPYFGTSIFVWTSLIGIILGSLSLGYWLGGRVADKKASFEGLSWIIFLSAVAIGLIWATKDPLLSALQNRFADVRLGSAIASLILFSPASVLLGMVSPYAVKLKIENLSTTASTVGNLYAISTAGSIAGTFLAGFTLIPWLGTGRILIFLTVALAMTALFVSFGRTPEKKALWLAIVILAGSMWAGRSYAAPKHGMIDVDSAYNRIWIYDFTDSNVTRPARKLGINNESQSAMYLESDDLVYEYTKYYHLIRHFNPGFKKALMIGGGAYSYPKDFLKQYPQASIDVVEIDPKLTELAKEHFRLREDPRLGIFHEDGRVFLNKNREKYDAFLGDAFASHYSVPWQLTTKEAVQKIRDALNPGGVAIVNLISAIEGRGSSFLRAEVATFQSVFQQVYLFPVRHPEDGTRVQNVMLVALNSDKKPSFETEDPELNEFLKHLWENEISTDLPMFTDDLAPVDYYIHQAL